MPGYKRAVSLTQEGIRAFEGCQQARPLKTVKGRLKDGRKM